MSRVRHIVVFALKHPDDSALAQNFLEAAQKLTHIAGVENFEIVREISSKNGYEWGIIMEFASKAAYEAYNHHPSHIEFVQNWWLANVEQFLEIDFAL